jgi:hypothetical protein
MLIADGGQGAPRHLNCAAQLKMLPRINRHFYEDAEMR